MKKTICSTLIALSMSTAAYANGGIDDLACKQGVVYTSGDICEWDGDLYLSNYWSMNSLPEAQSPAWTLIQVESATPWKEKTPYRRGDVVVFDDTYYTSTSWNYNNCPEGDSVACPSGASHYESWVEVPELNPNEITVTLLATLDDTGIPVTNALVILNGKNLGYTDSEGLFTYMQDTEEQINLEFRVINQGLAGGTEIISVIPGDDLEVTLSLSSSDVIEDFELEGIPEIITKQSQFSAVFVSKFGDKANISSLIEVLATHEATGSDIDVDEFFALTDDGKIELIDTVGLDSKLSELPDGALSLHFIAQDEDLLNYIGKVDVLHGKVATQIKVMAPADYPDLQLSTLEIHATYLKSPYQTVFEVDQYGSTASFQLPKGNWQFEVSWTDDLGKTYSSSAQLSIISNTNLQLNLLSLEEIIDGKPEFIKLATTMALFNTPSSQRQFPPQPQSMTISAMTSTGISVITGAQGVSNKVSKRFPITEGTQNVVLKYTVTSAEYPAYVKQQSVFNDVWKIDLRASSGVKLYSISREVNSQLYSQPLWQSNGTTQEITEVIDVSSLAQTSDEVVLTISATNIGDSALDTSINADLSINEIVIDSITLDSSLPDKRKSKLGKYFSIPASKANVFQRYLTVDVSKPDDVTIDKISVDLVHNGSETKIVTGSVGSEGIEQLSETQYKVRATFAQPSPFAVGSPVFSNFQYKVTVESDSATADKSTDQLQALWKLPSTISRFGSRDSGGDGWSSVETYNWLELNGSLITKVNDISGEHGRNIGHNTHKAGNDIDTLHFVEYHPNGTINYERLARTLISSLKGNAGEQAKVIAWVTAQRQGLDNLAANSKVKRLYSADGNPYEYSSIKLPDHWFTTIMTTGAITVGTLSFDTQLGAWSNAKVRRNDVHNNHDHITLNHN